MTFLETVQQIIRTMNVVDFIDIALVSFILYNLLLLARRSGAVSLIKGVASVVVIISITTWLPTFNWLLSRLFIPGIIALLVIFQPELRMALERLGRTGFLGSALSKISLNSDVRQRLFREVLEAVMEFSEKRIGALIVFERESGLMDITRTGKTLNARISAELLATIFFPKSPLHDGAVVIRNDTIVAAACVLPYSESPGLSANSGMRHRAALGLSERTDAVCLVVSEETGAISLAVDGALSRRLDRTQLTERLMALFEPEQEKSRWRFWKREA